METIQKLMANGDWKAAHSACEKLVFERPTCAQAHAYLGLCLYYQQQWDKALQCFHRATILNPTFWEAGLKMVQCLDRLLRLDEAYDVAVQWQKIRPNDKTLKGLVNSLSRYANPRTTDAWQRGKIERVHVVEFTH